VKRIILFTGFPPESLFITIQDSLSVFTFLVGFEIHLHEFHFIQVGEVGVNHPDAAHGSLALQRLASKFADLINLRVFDAKVGNALNAVMFLVELMEEVQGSGNKSVEILRQRPEFFGQLLEVPLKLG
jgi:hypothetical protein